MRSAIIEAFSALRFVLGRPAHLFRFGLWPLIACIVMAMVVGWQSGIVMGFLASLPGVSGTASLAIFLFLGGLPWGWFSAVFAVRWHRLVLIGEDRTSGLETAFSQRIGHFFAWVCLLDILFVVMAVGLFRPVMNTLLYLWFLVPAQTGLLDVIWSVGVTLASVALACAAYAFLLSQIALIFPSIAVDKPASLREVWRMGAGRRLRNFLTLFFVTIPAAVFLMVTDMVVTKVLVSAQSAALAADGPRETLPPGGLVLIETAPTIAVGTALYIVTVASTAVVLSNMYRVGIGRPNGPAIQ